MQSDFAGVALEASGDPGVIRTRDPQIRNLMLYPTELRGQPMGDSEARRQRHFI